MNIVHKILYHWFPLVSNKKYQSLCREVEALKEYHKNSMNDLHSDLQYLMRDVVHNISAYPKFYSGEGNLLINIELKNEEVKDFLNSSVSYKYEILGSKIANESIKFLKTYQENKKNGENNS